MKKSTFSRLLVRVSCLALLLALACASCAAAARYENSRFGYALEVPDGFDWLPESANGDGRHFAGTQATGEFSAWASYNVMEQSLKDAAVFAAQGHKIAYRRVNDREGWFVLSWLDENGCIVYRRDWLKDGVFYGLLFVYPRSSQKFFDGVIKSVTASFTF